ncbi:hypothetical protein D3C84_846360 [compost metagenome]
MLHAAFSELALCRLDRAAELPALADGDNLFRGDFALDHCVVNRANPDRVDADFVQQARLFHLFNQVSHLKHVIANSLRQCQIAVFFKVMEARGFCLSSLEYRGVRPGVGPYQPVTGSFVPAHGGKTQ